MFSKFSPQRVIGVRAARGRPLVALVGGVIGCLVFWAVALAGSAGALPSNCTQSGSMVTCTYSGAGTYTFAVPAEVSSLDVTAVGAGGGQGDYGGAGGQGASVEDPAVSVTAGQTLGVVVGGAGGAGTDTNGGAGGSPGGGGAGGDYPIGDTNALEDGGGGGGFSGVFSATTPSQANAMVIASGGGGSAGLGGGGGGAGWDSTDSGGQNGGAGSFSGAGGGGGGTSIAGGAGGASKNGGGNGLVGTALAGGQGGASIGRRGGGGGGGGYYGGGGGGGGFDAGGGGGGSSFPSSGVSESNTTAPASVTITYQAPADPDLSIATHANVTVPATSPSGAVVTHTAPTASDPDDTAAPSVGCLPASGSTFQIGDTTVTCTATDTDDIPSQAQTTFTVTVQGAAIQLNNLLSYTTGIGPGTSLSDQVQAALTDYQSGNTAGTCEQLTELINHANAQTGKKLTAAQARTIIADARRIQAVIGC